MKKHVEIIILHETPLGSWIRDASSLALFVSLIGIGVYLDSSAMQWLGAIVGFMVLVGKSINLSNKSKVSFEEARRRIDEIESIYK